MGWSNYLYNKEKKIAIDIGHSDVMEKDDRIFDFFEYMNNTERLNVSIVEHYWRLLGIPEPYDMVALLILSRDGWQWTSNEEDIEEYDVI